MDNIEYRNAKLSDLNEIVKFVDFWLSGRGLQQEIIGAVDDYFVPRQRHIHFIKHYVVLLALRNSSIIGWAVKQTDDTLIHLLIANKFRGKGIGTDMLRILNPKQVRSKSDQTTGDPIDFYISRGYKKKLTNKIGKNKNIDLLELSEQETTKQSTLST